MSLGSVAPACLAGGGKGSGKGRDRKGGDGNILVKANMVSGQTDSTSERGRRPHCAHPSLPTLADY